jgi:hypothetical protein
MEPAIRSLADQLQCPIDLVAMMTLATVSATVRGRIRAQFVDDWDEPLNLYIAAVLGPGETKSPALDHRAAAGDQLCHILSSSGCQLRTKKEPPGRGAQAV